MVLRIRGPDSQTAAEGGRGRTEVVTSEHLTDRARDRVARRAPGYRAAGLWHTDPVDLVGDAVARDPERAALVERGRALTYRELHAAVDGAVAALRVQGVARGDAVLLLVGNDVPSAVAVHAALRLGALTMVAPVSAGRAQVDDIIAMTKPTLVLAPESLVPDETSARWLPIGAVGDAAPITDAPPSPRDPDEPSVVIFTSGTTSRPKGVVHSFNTMLVATRNYIDAACLTAADNLFVISPLASITGMLQVITIAPLLGAQLTIESRFEDAATFDLLMETGGTFFGGPDLLLDRVLDQAASRAIAEVPITAVYLGGSMLDPRILDRAEHEYGIVVLRAYGSSEAPISTGGARGETQAVRLADDGRALGGVEVRIGSSADPAECCIGGAHLFLGYVDPDDDAGAFDGEWFCTGDLAELRGGRLKIVGRIKDIVIRNGLKVPISEIDGMVGALAGVAQCAGYGVADDTTGERLAIAVRPAAGASFTFDAMVAGLVAAGAAKWKIPEELVLWDDELPMTASGKVQRNRLEELGAARPREVAARLR
jgi:acyl-CoA synthetase (AMP-forming)/AMP-acid ligase II